MPPDTPHAGSFKVTAVDGALTAIEGSTADQAGPCAGDIGGPGVRSIDGKLQLVGITRTGGQGGCYGAAAGAPRGGSQTRLDDVAVWVQETTAELTVNIMTAQSSNMCLAMSNNLLNGSGALADFRLAQGGLTTMRFPLYAGANNDNDGVVAFIRSLQQLNTETTPTGIATNTVAGGGGGFLGGPACSTP